MNELSELLITFYVN